VVDTNREKQNIATTGVPKSKVTSGKALTKLLKDTPAQCAEIRQGLDIFQD